MPSGKSANSYIRSLRPHSNKEVNRAAAELVSPSDAESFKRAVEIVAEWRTLHYGMVWLFRSILDVETRTIDPEGFVADRLKRIPTIIEKLGRQPHMKLSTMQDIGGLRAVVDNVAQARALSDRLSTMKPIGLASAFSLKLPIKDYIQNPAASGYRGLHLVYRYRSTREENKKYEGLKIEVQVRTRLQHTWATAVETVGTFRGESLKSGHGDPRWLEFFRLAGELVGQKENTGSLTLAPELIALRDQLYVFDRLSAFSVAQKLAEDPEVQSDPDVQKARYFLLVLDTKEFTVTVNPFPAEDFERAVKWQRYEEMLHLGQDHVDTVLVTADSLTELRAAYPNYFADIGDFIDLVYGGNPPATYSALPLERV
jgi:ppGpp synthetase/RelA/SpoT-type nucleotidyltranferase